MTGKPFRVSTEELARRYLAGESILMIAKIANYSPAAISARLRKAGVQMRPIGVYRQTEASYSAYHHRVTAARGKPKACEDCGCTDPACRYEWANLTGNYADPNDYKRLCKPCHVLFDDIARKVSQTKRANVYSPKLRSTCRRGHPFDPANTYVRPNGDRRCRECMREWDRRRNRTEHRREWERARDQRRKEVTRGQRLDIR